MAKRMTDGSEIEKAEQKLLSVRLTKKARRYLKKRKKKLGISMNTQVELLVREKIKEDPLSNHLTKKSYRFLERMEEIKGVPIITQIELLVREKMKEVEKDG